MTKKNILMVIDSMGIGGAEKVTLTLAKGFVKEGHSVALVICDDIVGFDIPSTIKLYRLNFQKSFMDYTRYRQKLHNLIKKIIVTNQKEFDLILVNLQKSTRLMSGYKHKKIFHIVHSTFSQSALKGKKGLKLFFRKRKLQRIYNGLNIITVSEGIEDDLLSMINISPKSIQTIYNPVDVEELHELAMKQQLIPKDNYIVHIGRFSKVKRHDILLKAFQKTDLDVKLILVGDGEEKENIVQLIDELNLKNRVILLGFLQNPYPIMKNAKILILSSEYEGLPTVLIEALALDTLIISTDCKSGPKEIMVNELVNYLVENKNIVALTNKINEVYNHPYIIKSNYIKPFLLSNILLKYRLLMK